MTLTFKYSFSFPHSPYRGGRKWDTQLTYSGLGVGKRAYITCFSLQTGGFSGFAPVWHVINPGTARIFVDSSGIRLRTMSNRGISRPSIKGDVLYPAPRKETSGTMFILIYNDNTLNNRWFFRNGPEPGYTVDSPGAEMDNASPDTASFAFYMQFIESAAQSFSRTNNLPTIHNYYEWTKEQVDATPALPWRDPQALSDLLLETSGSPKLFNADFEAPGGLGVIPYVWQWKHSVNDSAWRDGLTTTTSGTRIIRNHIGGFADNEAAAFYDIPR